MEARVIGLGQSAAGDDGVGAVVVQCLRRRGLPGGIDLCLVAEPSALVALFESQVPVVLVDAVLGAPAGQVVELTSEDLAAGASLRVSSHGLGVAEAIGLGRALHGGRPPAVRIVAVTIARPARYGQDLSPEVAAAVPRAAERVLQLLGVDHA